MSAIAAYITTKDREEAFRIGKSLLESRLVACINVLEGMSSMYWWKGRLESSRECVLIAKSIPARREEIIAAVGSMHGYEVPCVVFWPLEGGNPDYLAWIEQEARGA